MSGDKRKPCNVYKHANSRFWQMEFGHGGVTYRKSSKTTNKREAIARAKEWRDSILDELAEKPTRLLPDMTFDEAAGLYWRQHGQHTRDSEGLDRNIKTVVLMVGADTMCSKYTRGDEREIRAALREGKLLASTNGRGRPKKNEGRYSERTINGYCRHC